MSDEDSAGGPIPFTHGVPVPPASVDDENLPVPLLPTMTPFLLHPWVMKTPWDRFGGPEPPAPMGDKDTQDRCVSSLALTGDKDQGLVLPPPTPSLFPCTHR